MRDINAIGSLRITRENCLGTRSHWLAKIGARSIQNIYANALCSASCAVSFACSDACHDRLIRARIFFTIASHSTRPDQSSSDLCVPCRYSVRTDCESALMQEYLGTEVSDDEPWKIQHDLCAGSVQICTDWDEQPSSTMGANSPGRLLMRSFGGLVMHPVSLRRGWGKLLLQNPIPRLLWSCSPKQFEVMDRLAR
jgi:hypothetical protein